MRGFYEYGQRFFSPKMTVHVQGTRRILYNGVEVLRVRDRMEILP